MKKLSKDAENRILTALESVANSVNEGRNPNDAIVKAASDHDIPAGHVNLMVSAYNTGRTGKQRMAGVDPFDKAATFELANSQDIMSRLYPTNVKSAAQKRDETIVDDEYSQVPTFAHRKEAAHIAARKLDWSLVDKPPKPYRGEEPTAVKRAVHSIEFDGRRLEECRREISRAKDLLTSNFEKISAYFRTPGGVSFDDACDVVEIQHGGMGRAILNQISRNVPQFSKEAKHNCSIIHPSSTHEQWLEQNKKKRQEKSAALIEVQPTQAPWVWIRECIKLAADVHEKQRSLQELSQHVTKRAEDKLRPLVSRSGNSVLKQAEGDLQWRMKHDDTDPADDEEYHRRRAGDGGQWMSSADASYSHVTKSDQREEEQREKLEELRNEQKLEQEEAKEAAWPGDETAAHALVGAGIGAGGAGLSTYLSSRGDDEEEDEEDKRKPPYLRNIALGGLFGAAGGVGVDYLKDQYTTPDAAEPTGTQSRTPAEEVVADTGSDAGGGGDEGAGILGSLGNAALAGVAPIPGQSATDRGFELGGAIPGPVGPLSTIIRALLRSKEGSAEIPHQKKSSVGGIFALSHLFKNVGSTLGGSTERQEHAISDYIEELDDPAHQEEMKRIAVRAQLENMMANDPVISKEDPAMVAEAYNEIVQLAPRSADSPLLMRNLIRQHLSGQEGGGGIMDPRDIESSILKPETSLQRLTENMMQQDVGAPGQKAISHRQSQADALKAEEKNKVTLKDIGGALKKPFTGFKGKSKGTVLSKDEKRIIDQLRKAYPPPGGAGAP